MRFAVSLEKHPDLFFTTRPSAARAGEPSTPGAGEPGWLLVELQNRKDESKSKSWYLATSVLFQKSGMGDLVVLTASRSVARWATQVAQHRGPLGTKKGLTPVVLLLSRKETDRLLDPAFPQLALFAVWARGRGAGAEAKEVVTRALDVTEALPDGLQEAQIRAIVSMLSERLLRYLKEMSMDVSQIKETKAARKFRLFFEKRGHEEGVVEGLCAGKREALRAVLAARGLVPDATERAQIDSLDDSDLLDRCIGRAVTTSSVADVLAPPGKGSSARARPANGKKKANGHAR